MTTLLGKMRERGTLAVQVEGYSEENRYVPMPRSVTMLTPDDADLLLTVAELVVSMDEDIVDGLLYGSQGYYYPAVKPHIEKIEELMKLRSALVKDVEP